MRVTQAESWVSVEAMAEKGSEERSLRDRKRKKRSGLGLEVRRLAGRQVQLPVVVMC